MVQDSEHFNTCPQELPSVICICTTPQPLQLEEINGNRQLSWGGNSLSTSIHVTALLMSKTQMDSLKQWVNLQMCMHMHTQAHTPETQQKCGSLLPTQAFWNPVHLQHIQPRKSIGVQGVRADEDYSKPLTCRLNQNLILNASDLYQRLIGQYNPLPSRLSAHLAHPMLHYQNTVILTQVCAYINMQYLKCHGSKSFFSMALYSVFYQMQYYSPFHIYFLDIFKNIFSYTFNLLR